MTLDRNRLIVAAALAAGALFAAAVEFWPAAKSPEPTPAIDLRGKWIGENAAGDAAAFAGVCGAIAAALEHDGQAAHPRITTGVQLEDLRTATSEFRFAPRPLRERQPHVRAIVGKFLDDAAGTSGGPLDAAGRQRWVAAFRDLSAAAEASVK